MSQTTTKPEANKLLMKLENSGDLTDFEVPSPKSGVTFGFGVDLKETSEMAISVWEKDFSDLKTETGVSFKTAIGLSGADAKKWIKDNKPSVSFDTADIISRNRIIGYRMKLASRIGKEVFYAMEKEVSDVAVSVFYQYGRIERCPAFFGVSKTEMNQGIKQYADACKRNDIEDKIRILVSIIAELRDFGDDFPTRRGKEADHIQVVLDSLLQSQERNIS